MYSEGKNQERIDQGRGRTASPNLILTSDQPREEEEQKRGGRGGGERGERKVAGNGGYPQTRPLLTLGSFILLWNETYKYKLPVWEGVDGVTSWQSHVAVRTKERREKKRKWLQKETELNWTKNLYTLKKNLGSAVLMRQYKIFALILSKEKKKHYCKGDNARHIRNYVHNWTMIRCTYMLG